MAGHELKVRLGCARMARAWRDFVIFTAATLLSLAFDFDYLGDHLLNITWAWSMVNAKEICENN